MLRSLATSSALAAVRDETDVISEFFESYEAGR